MLRLRSNRASCNSIRTSSSSGIYNWVKDSNKEVLFFADAGNIGKKIVEKLLDADRKAAKVLC